MQMEIDTDCLSDNELYHLTKGLEVLKNPSQSCKEVLAELNRLARKSYEEHLRKYPYDWV